MNGELFQSSIASRPFRLRSKCSICSRRFESRRWSHRGQALSSGFLDIGRDHPSSLGPVPRIVSTLQCRRVRSTPVSFGKRDSIKWKKYLPRTSRAVKLWYRSSCHIEICCSDKSLFFTDLHIFVILTRLMIRADHLPLRRQVFGLYMWLSSDRLVTSGCIY